MTTMKWLLIQQCGFTYEVPVVVTVWTSPRLHQEKESYSTERGVEHKNPYREVIGNGQLKMCYVCREYTISYMKT